MTDDRPPLRASPRWLSTVSRTAAGAVKRLAFWTAVVLPLAYVPLFAAELAAPAPETVAALVAVNVLAVLFGHRHGRHATA